jgi:hypothetical protein
MPSRAQDKGGRARGAYFTQTATYSCGSLLSRPTHSGQTTSYNILCVPTQGPSQPCRQLLITHHTQLAAHVACSRPIAVPGAQDTHNVGGCTNHSLVHAARVLRPQRPALVMIYGSATHCVPWHGPALIGAGWWTTGVLTTAQAATQAAWQLLLAVQHVDRLLMQSGCTKLQSAPPARAAAAHLQSTNG